MQGAVQYTDMEGPEKFLSYAIRQHLGSRFSRPNPAPLRKYILFIFLAESPTTSHKCRRSSDT